MDAPPQTDTDFEAAFTLAELKNIETNDRFTFGRRVMLLALSKNKQELASTVRSIGAEPFGAWLDHIETFQRELKHLQELSESAHARLLAAGQMVVEQDRLAN
jgi:hypothetical protein